MVTETRAWSAIVMGIASIAKTQHDRLSSVPTIFREDGFRFSIYFNDHLPAHVHVWHAGFKARINIGSVDGWPYVTHAGAMPTASLWRAVQIVEREQEYFLKAWRSIHGRA